MDDEQRAEIFRIQVEQRALRAQIDALDARVARLVRPGATQAAAPAAPPPPPPVLMAEGPPPLPAPVEAAVPLPPPPAPAPAAIPKGSLEVEFGAKWFVRLAIFMLVAALAFLVNYLYQTVIPHLGPAAKVGLLYLGAGGVTALGLWLERGRGAKVSEGLLDYARVVLAGGLAAVYYVTYAAHHYEPLRVISSPLVAGLLLLGWTALMAWLADWRNSEPLAGFSILLAYFTSATSEVAGFALVANLGLTAAAVFLVLRRRWTAFGFASLAATFGSYAYWRYGGDLSMGVARAGLWMDGLFLACYWALFTLTAFIDRQQTLAAQGRRGTFVSLNNGAFFVLVGLLVRADYPGQFWKWCLLLGAAMLALGELGRRLRKPLDAPTVDSYYFGGVGLVTLGLMLYFSGWQLSLILAVESATVLALSGRRASKPLFLAAAAVAVIAAGVALEQTQLHCAWLPGLFCGAVLLSNAWQCRWTRPERSQLAEGLYSLLGLAVWFALLEAKITDEVVRAPILAVAALGLTALLLPLRIPAALALAQGFLGASLLHWMVAYGVEPATMAPPLWNPAAVLIVTATLGTFWEWSRKRPGSASIPQGIGIPYEAAGFFFYAVAVDKYFSGAGEFTAYALGSVAALGLAWVARLRRQIWWALALAVCATILYTAATDRENHGAFGYLPGILLLAAAQQFARRLGRERGISSPRWEGAMISLAVLCGWSWVSSRLGGAAWGAFTTSAGWALYGGALFAAGILARERVCRWWGLGVLAAALVHILSCGHLGARQLRAVYQFLRDEPGAAGDRLLLQPLPVKT